MPKPAAAKTFLTARSKCVVTALFAVTFGLSAASAARSARVANPGVADGKQAGAEGFGTLDPTPPTGLTVDQIVERMGKREAEFALQREQYIFRQSVKVDTISEDTGKPDGEYQQIEDITFGQGGKREEHVVFAPQNTIERVIMTPADFEEIRNRLPFILTTDQLPQYDMTYLGKQKVDEVDTYVFDVKPRRLEKGKKYFQGKAWVDQRDLEIVVVTGTTVPQDTRRGHEDLQPPFTTYYQQIDGKYWFPTYTKAEGTLHFSAQDGALSQDVHMRNIVKYTDYKRFRSTSTLIFNGEALPENTPDKTPPPPPAPPKK